MSFCHFMIDIEALGQRAGSAITEIAAVTFDPETGETGHEFLVHVKPMLPFVCDYETIQWHKEHGSTIDHPDAVEPREAIAKLCAWLDEAIPDAYGRVPWSWGITYDFPLLDPLVDMRPAGAPEPWRFFQVRDARTIWRTAFGYLKHEPRPHEALADTKAAIADLVRALRELRK